MTLLDTSDATHSWPPLQGHMGELEVRDQVRGLRQAAQEVDYLDLKRVAIVGWSYGKAPPPPPLSLLLPLPLLLPCPSPHTHTPCPRAGGYMALMGLAREPQVFKVSIKGVPCIHALP